MDMEIRSSCGHLAFGKEIKKKVVKRGSYGF